MTINAYWRFDGNSNDASGNGRNMTDTDITYSQQNGKINQGAGCNGTSSKIVYTGFIGTAFQGYISTFIKFTTLASVNTVFALGSSTNINGILLAIEIRNDPGTQRVCIVHQDGRGVTTWAFYGNTVITTNKWYHIVLTSDGSTWKLYVDGVLQTLTALSFNSGTNNGNWFGDIQQGSATIYNSLGALIYIGTWQAYSNSAIDESKIGDNNLYPASVKNEYSRIKGFF
jgi:hypothetical protein